MGGADDPDGGRLRRWAQGIGRWDDLDAAGGNRRRRRVLLAVGLVAVVIVAAIVATATSDAGDPTASYRAFPADVDDAVTTAGDEVAAPTDVAASPPTTVPGNTTPGSSEPTTSITAPADGTATTADDTPTSTTAPAVRSGDGEWPIPVRNRPAVLGRRGEPPPDPLTAGPGAYLWVDDQGWHLWLVHGPGLGRVTGTITSDTPFAWTIADRAFKETGNELLIDVQQDTGITRIAFASPAEAHALIVDLRTDDVPLERSQLRTGAALAPAETPLALNR